MDKKIKLNTFQGIEMKREDLRQICGGAECGCACEKNETNDNGDANHSGGKFSPNVPKTDQTIFIDEVVVTP